MFQADVGPRRLLLASAYAAGAVWVVAALAGIASRAASVRAPGEGAAQGWQTFAAMRSGGLVAAPPVATLARARSAERGGARVVGDARGVARPAPVSRDVEIVGVDYAFEVPTRVAAGPTTFHFRNAGRVQHELNISLLRPGATVRQFVAAIGTDSAGMYREASVGVLFAAPGRRTETGLSTNLLPGRTYAVICIDQDTPTARKHFAMGMYSALVVGSRTTPARPVARARVDTISGTEYAFRYPRAMTAGAHRFAFVNRGTAPHEVLMLLLKRGVTLPQLLDVYRSGGDARPMIEDAVGVLLGPPGTSPLGVLDVDLRPGREYTLICTATSDARSPPHVMLGMMGTIRVASAGPRPRE